MRQSYKYSMRNIILGLALLVLAPIPSSALASPDIPLHERCLYPTIKVTPKSKDSYGTGVIVRSTKVAEGVYRNVFLSCAHISDHNDPYVVRVFEYENWSTIKRIKSYPCVFYGKDNNRDLSIGVFVTTEKMPTAEFDMGDAIYIGTEVFRIGCGLGDEPRLDYGRVTSVRTSFLKNTLPLLRTSVQTVPGDSGGPLFNKYKVVGIAKSIRVWNDNYIFGMSYYVPVRRLVEWSNESDNVFHFAWEANRDLPTIPFWILDFQSKYQITRSEP